MKAARIHAERPKPALGEARSEQRPRKLLALLGLWLLSALLIFSAVACRKQQVDSPTSAPRTNAIAAQRANEPGVHRAAQARPTKRAQAVTAPRLCSAAPWSQRTLPPLLEPGKRATQAQPDRAASAPVRLAPQCGDSPADVSGRTPRASLHDGVMIELVEQANAGKSGRGWPGYACTFQVRFADGAGVPTQLGPKQIPPFTDITALVRSGSAAWLSVTFNGYTKEFPNGGNRILAIDLCEGRVVWQSEDSMSNGGLLLVGDYLISPYGFTSERRYVYVLDSQSGNVIQKLPVIENICPSKSWAPNWRQGERCDTPGQRVGAATMPRVEGGVLLVDTNTGSSAFQFR